MNLAASCSCENPTYRLSTQDWDQHEKQKGAPSPPWLLSEADKSCLHGSESLLRREGVDSIYEREAQERHPNSREGESWREFKGS